MKRVKIVMTVDVSDDTEISEVIKDMEKRTEKSLNQLPTSPIVRVNETNGVWKISSVEIKKHE